MKKRLLIILFCFGLLTSIQAQHDHDVQKGNKAQTQQAISNQTNSQFQAQLTAVYQSSQQLNEAFISSDAKKAQ